MAGWTNRGKLKMWQHFFLGTPSPTGFTLVLLTGAAAPGPDTNDMTGLTEIANGNGYTTGGLTVTRDISASGFETAAEDDTNDRATMQLANKSWAATPGPIPASGAAARWALLLDNSGNAIAYFDLASDRVASAGQTLTLQDPELRLSNVVGVTNRGKLRILQSFLAGVSNPGGFFLALCTSAVDLSNDATGRDINTLSQLTQIATGNGYTVDGATVARSAVGFEAAAEDDALDRATVQLQDVVFTASGAFPASGGGARYAVLTDDNATPANRDVLCFFDLVSDRTISSGQTLTVKDAEIRALES